jgi:hypothetical protein
MSDAQKSEKCEQLELKIKEVKAYNSQKFG